MYPTFRTGATNPGIDPTVDPDVDPAGMSLQEPFTGIDEEFNGGLEAQQVVDLEGKQEDSTSTRVKWKDEKQLFTFECMV